MSDKQQKTERAIIDLERELPSLLGGRVTTADLRPSTKGESFDLEESDVGVEG